MARASNHAGQPRDPRTTRLWMRRRRHAAATLPQPCPYCGQPVLPSDDWHLAHAIAVAHGGTDTSPALPAHASCNLSAAHSVRRLPNAAPSRAW